MRSRPRFLASIAAFAILASIGVSHAGPVSPADDFSATPTVDCSNDPLHESTQGRTPLADYAGGTSSRAAQGYSCNAEQLAFVGADDGSTGGHGGYRVYRYVDSNGNICAFFDTTLLYPVNAKAGGTNLTGVWVLDMNPDHWVNGVPPRTASLVTPAMQSPHESFSLNRSRGLLGAVFANPAFYHGQFDLYDVKDDCLHPTPLSTLPMGVLGHEGSFSPDGNTYYAASLYGHTLTAIDTSNPLATKIIWSSTKWNVHGMNVSDDGNLLYFADVSRNGAPDIAGQTGTATKGLTILDVSQVQSRQLNPNVEAAQDEDPFVPRVSHITWAHVGTPQTALPFTAPDPNNATVKRHYLVEIDEFGGVDNVGAARIIDVEDPTDPFVVSNMRLAVNNLAGQNDPDQKADPAASNSLGGYRGHYCSIPRQDNPLLVACSFILSGLRVFDISHLARPIEIAYFNKPSVADGVGTTGYGPQGSYAMSQPAFDIAGRQIWYSDGNTGFYALRIDDAVWPSGLADCGSTPDDPYCAHS
ncbi:MAG: hypothetical protein LC750_12090 [Actinobacteria bacterium]|nr:hypothetical protein [Actinomycetota bacterium]